MRVIVTGDYTQQWEFWGTGTSRFVPEPSTIALLGLAGIFAAYRRRER
jgi:hypothetical protein